MTLPLYYYVLGTPLGVLGLFRWGCWLIRRVPAVLYKPVVNDFRTSMSIAVPVYQEDPIIFETAIQSWLANGAWRPSWSSTSRTRSVRRSRPGTR